MTAVAEIARVLVGVIFVAHGIVLIRPPRRVRDRIGTEAGPLTLAQFRVLGVAEVAGGLALVVLPALGIATALADAAAAGMAIVLVLATALHVRERKPSSTAFTLFCLALLAVAVAGAR